MDHDVLFIVFDRAKKNVDANLLPTGLLQITPYL